MIFCCTSSEAMVSSIFSCTCCSVAASIFLPDLLRPHKGRHILGDGLLHGGSLHLQLHGGIHLRLQLRTLLILLHGVAHGVEHLPQHLLAHLLRHLRRYLLLHGLGHAARI